MKVFKMIQIPLHPILLKLLLPKQQVIFFFIENVFDIRYSYTFFYFSEGNNTSHKPHHIFSASEVNKLNELVKLQVHKCSKHGCLKKNGKCRFNFPRPPSEKTFVTKPLPNNMPDEEKLFKTNKAKSILEKVKKVLTELSEKEATEMNFHTFLEMINVTSEEYYEALSISIDGQGVILKRCVGERFVNTYHPIFLLKWQANIDVQVVRKNTDYKKDLIHLHKFLQ